MADSNSSNRLTSPASFSYPQAYVVHRNRIRAARRRRRFWTKRLFVGFFCILGFSGLLTGSLRLLISSYSTKIVNMRRNFSCVYTANPLFVKKIVVTNRLQNEGPIIYGFSTTPELSKELDWTEVHGASVPSKGHQEWDFWLNKGSQVKIEYNFSDSSKNMLLVVVRGEENMRKWAKDPSTIDSVSSWETAQGIGALQYEVDTDGRYFFAFGNPRSENTEVNVKLSFQSKVHNSDNYKTQCHLISKTCAIWLDYFGSNALLLTTPQTDQGIDHEKAFYTSRSMQEDPDDDGLWSVNVVFEQRWFTYLVFWGAMAIFMLILLTLCRPSLSETDAIQESLVPVTEAIPPVVVSFVDEDKDQKAEQSEACSIFLSDDDQEGTEDPENTLCIICFDQQRNCFFDPCGHCATCYMCSMKISKEKLAICPLCRQPIKVVRKIFVC